MVELLVSLLGAILAAALTVMVMWPMQDLPDEALTIAPVIAGTIGGAIGFLLVWATRQTSREPTIATRPTVKSRSMQIVGANCAMCDERVMFIADAHLCERCGKVFCRDCEPNLPCSSCQTPSAGSVD